MGVAVAGVLRIGSCTKLQSSVVTPYARKGPFQPFNPLTSLSSLEANTTSRNPRPPAERNPGASPRFTSTTSFLQNDRLSFIPSTRKNAYIAPGGVAACTPGIAFKAANEEIAGAPIPFNGALNHFSPDLYRCQSRALDEHRTHEVLYSISLPIWIANSGGATSQPSSTRSSARIGERICANQPVSLLRNVEERRAAAPAPNHSRS